ncbi:MAG: hypothetical protein ACHQIM_21185 [Sphingobacteriales bacterium]
MKGLLVCLLLLLSITFSFSQGYLGQTRAQLLEFKKVCDMVGNYGSSLAFKCNGQKIFFYFSADSTCDLYAADVNPKTANDTVQKLLANGFQKIETRYLEPFMVSKKTDHQRFPTRVYSNGKVECCIMPVSLNGKSTEQIAVITRYIKK